MFAFYLIVLELCGVGWICLVCLQILLISFARFCLRLVTDLFWVYCFVVGFGFLCLLVMFCSLLLVVYYCCYLLFLVVWFGLFCLVWLVVCACQTCGFFLIVCLVAFVSLVCFGGYLFVGLVCFVFVLYLIVVLDSGLFLTVWYLCAYSRCGMLGCCVAYMELSCVLI